ncbi:MAG: hypothetical protein AAFQ15_14545, partial [Pseudomonadota bacterium]
CIEPAKFDQCELRIEQAARAAQRGEYDLSSQQTVANWTFVTGLMAIFGVALSVVGVVLIWRTWHEAIKASNAGLAANELAARAQRPWLTIKLEELIAFSVGEVGVPAFDQSEQGYLASISAQIRNVGTSPATHVQVIGYCFDRTYLFSDKPGKFFDALHEDFGLQWGSRSDVQWGSLLTPNEHMTHVEMLKVPFRELGTNETHGRDGFLPYAVLAARYRAAGSDRWHVTVRGFTLRKLGPIDFAFTDDAKINAAAVELLPNDFFDRAS